MPNTDVFLAIEDELKHARRLHPNQDTLPQAANLIGVYADQLNRQVNSPNDPDAYDSIPRTAIQVAALVIRMLQDHELPLPEPRTAI